jgi:hypothetical protein
MEIVALHTMMLTLPKEFADFMTIQNLMRVRSAVNVPINQNVNKDLIQLHNLLFASMTTP